MARPSDPKEDRAIERYQWIAPLLGARLDAAKGQPLKAEISAQTGWCWRSLVLSSLRLTFVSSDTPPMSERRKAEISPRG